MGLEDKLTAQLKADEGVRQHVYKDHLGYETIGVGRLVDERKPGSGLRMVEIEFMLANDIHDRYRQLNQTLTFFKDLDEARQGALLNMSFQLGVEGLLAFKNTLSAIRRGEYEVAAAHMLDSLWAKQTPARARRMAAQISTGEWQ